MLEEVLNYLHNFFVAGIYEDDYIIRDGSIALPFLQDGQYFRIFGSVFNDGVYKYGEELGLVDECFTGTVWALAIPKSVIALVDEIQKWQDTYGTVALSPYTSESFGGYSYTKSASASSDVGISWKDIFASRLAPYKKIADLTVAEYSGYQDPCYKKSFNPGWSV